MNCYAAFGYRKFVIALGYRGEMIKEFFMNIDWKLNDFTLHTNDHRKKEMITHVQSNWEDFEITFVDTGLETQTGGRIKRLEKHIKTEDFFATYCDGLSDLNIRTLHEFHKKNKSIATMTAVHPITTFGLIEIGEQNRVTSFREKPFLKDYINGGFFVFKKEFFDYVTPEDILEEEPMKKLSAAKELTAYKHEGFWACMDTHKDVERLNSLWYKKELTHTSYKGQPPWVH